MTEHNLHVSSFTVCYNNANKAILHMTEWSCQRPNIITQDCAKMKRAKRWKKYNRPIKLPEPIHKYHFLKIWSSWKLSNLFHPGVFVFHDIWMLHFWNKFHLPRTKSNRKLCFNKNKFEPCRLTLYIYQGLWLNLYVMARMTHKCYHSGALIHNYPRWR